MGYQFQHLTSCKDPAKNRKKLSKEQLTILIRMFLLVGGTGVPRETPGMHGENMQTPTGKALHQESNP